jgi:hypothetical protein
MKKQEIPPLDRFLVLTTIAIAFWVFFEVYRNFRKQPPVVAPVEVMAPFDPTLDMTTLNSLKTRLKPTN